jgi:hypothetical protein
MSRQCSEEIENAEKTISELEEEQNSASDFKEHINKIRQVLIDAKRDASSGIISKDFIDKYIDKIFVTPENGSLRLDIKIFTGEITAKYLTKLRDRTGHTSKKMIEAYENGIK